MHTLISCSFVDKSRRYRLPSVALSIVPSFVVPSSMEVGGATLYVGMRPNLQEKKKKETAMAAELATVRLLPIYTLINFTFIIAHEIRR